LTPYLPTPIDTRQVRLADDLNGLVERLATSAKILTAGLIVLAASPAFVPPRPGGPGGPGGFGPPAGLQMTAAMLLRNDKIVEELKLTDDQKADVKKAVDKVNEKYRDEFDKARGDREKIGDLFKSQNEDMEKAMVSVLKADQAKRLKQIEVQAAGTEAFSRDDLQSALKLTDKQKKTVREEQDGLQQVIRDLFKDAQGDREKMAAIVKKSQTLRAETLANVVKGLSDDQKTSGPGLVMLSAGLHMLSRPNTSPK
jgi:hypothetical protein